MLSDVVTVPLVAHLVIYCNVPARKLNRSADAQKREYRYQVPSPVHSVNLQKVLNSAAAGGQSTHKTRQSQMVRFFNATKDMTLALCGAVSGLPPRDD